MFRNFFIFHDQEKSLSANIICTISKLLTVVFIFLFGFLTYFQYYTSAPLWISSAFFIIILNSVPFRRKATLLLNCTIFAAAALYTIGSLAMPPVEEARSSIEAIQALILCVTALILQDVAMVEREAWRSRLVAERRPIEEIWENSQLAIENFKIREALSRMNRITVVEAMTTTIAHEMGQPIGSALTFAEASRSWLTRPAPDVQEATKALTGAISQISRAGQVLSSIRRLAARNPGKSKETSIDDLVRSLLDLMRDSIEHQEVALTLENRMSDPGIVAFVRPGDISQVIINLVNNAVEAFPHGQASKTITVALTLAPGDWLYIDIIDNGPGISQSELGRIFDSFYTTKPKGMGLGLAICREIAENHGGSLIIESEPGVGTTASLRIPVV
ncbi:sensor histidine kinase [Sphingopyxis sp.]|uniref:sensor histidine kinase n=1 Tax=Sphingopyxis sp. TaxID=1908224 RepID=UPI003BA9D749